MSQLKQIVNEAYNLPLWLHIYGFLAKLITVGGRDILKLRGLEWLCENIHIRYLVDLSVWENYRVFVGQLQVLMQFFLFLLSKSYFSLIVFKRKDNKNNLDLICTLCKSEAERSSQKHNLAKHFSMTIRVSCSFFSYV